MKSIIVPPLNCFKVMPRGRDFDTPVTMAEASRRIFMPVLRDPSRHHGIGKVADTRQVFWEYFGEGESFTSRGFVGVRRSGSTVSYIRVNYLDDINIGVLAFRSLRVKRVLSLPPCFIYRG